MSTGVLRLGRRSAVVERVRVIRRPPVDVVGLGLVERLRRRQEVLRELVVLVEQHRPAPVQAPVERQHLLEAVVRRERHVVIGERARAGDRGEQGAHRDDAERSPAARPQRRGAEHREQQDRGRDDHHHLAVRVWRAAMQQVDRRQRDAGQQQRTERAPPQRPREAEQRQHAGRPQRDLLQRLERRLERVVAVVPAEPDAERLDELERGGEVAEIARGSELAAIHAGVERRAVDLDLRRQRRQHGQREQHGDRARGDQPGELAPAALAGEPDPDDRQHGEAGDEDERQRGGAERAQRRRRGDREDDHRTRRPSLPDHGRRERREAREHGDEGKLLDRSLQRVAEHERRLRGRERDERRLPAAAQQRRDERREPEEQQQRREAQQRLVEPGEVDDPERSGDAEQCLRGDRIVAEEVRRDAVIRRAHLQRRPVRPAIGEQLRERELVTGVRQREVAGEARRPAREHRRPEDEIDADRADHEPRIGAQRAQAREAEHEPDRGEQRGDRERERRRRARWR